MKILKREKVKSRSVKVTCVKCSSELEYEPSDVQQDGNYIICPVCSYWIFIRSNQLDR